MTPRSAPESLAGRLLLAHPALKDPNFGRSVVLLSAHDPDGALGVIINRPLGRSLGTLGAGFSHGPLAGVPLYCGGPVATEKLVLAAWRWAADSGSFELQFGLDPDEAARLAGKDGIALRGFLGYAGWSRGQLEQEMRRTTWFVAEPEGFNLGAAEGAGLWKMILGALDPELKLLAGEPDDPSRN